MDSTKQRWQVSQQFFVFFPVFLGAQIPFAQNWYTTLQMNLKSPLLHTSTLFNNGKVT